MNTDEVDGLKPWKPREPERLDGPGLTETLALWFEDHKQTEGVNS